jgi:hypothetical protein
VEGRVSETPAARTHYHPQRMTPSGIFPTKGRDDEHGNQYQHDANEGAGPRVI